MTISQPLWQPGSFVAGQWQEEATHGLFDVTNPVDGEVLAQLPRADRGLAEQAVMAAHGASVGWSQMTAKERANSMMAWYRLIIQHTDELALLMTREQGKPLVESRGEVAYGASFIEWFAEEGKRAYGRIVPTPNNDRRILVQHKPVGVCALITPWNFPLAMITRKAAPALAAGCTVVIKPAPQTPLTALALAALAQQAGIPAGVVNVVVSDRAEDIGACFTSHPEVAKLSFTGSTAVGKRLMAQCANTVKKISLELGGNAPFVVFESADVDAAVAGAMASKYRNSGQTCVCANRFLVHSAIKQTFVDKLIATSRQLTVGDGRHPGVQQGPMIDDRAVSKVQSLLSDACDEGAKVVLGGNRHALGGRFFEPTVVLDVTQQMAIARQEIFGPVATIISFDEESEALALANDTRYGLAAYLYSRDIGQIFRFTEALEYGMVAVNEGILSTEVAPFGGVKESGLGREGGLEGLQEYLETQYVCLGGL